MQETQINNEMRCTDKMSSIMLCGTIILMVGSGIFLITKNDTGNDKEFASGLSVFLFSSFINLIHFIFMPKSSINVCGFFSKICKKEETIDEVVLEEMNHSSSNNSQAL